MRGRRSPLRSCIGCRAIRPKRELVRLVRTPADGLALDSMGKLPGRGAYLCPRPECFQAAQKRKSFERAFRRPVTAAEAAALEAAIQTYLKERAIAPAGAPETRKPGPPRI